MPSVTQCATFESKCATCGHVFPWPVLSDMSYGEALLHGVRGTVHAHASLIDNRVFDMVQQFVSRSHSAGPSPQWEVFARLADPVDGQTLTCRMICPYCGSDDRAYWGGLPRVGMIEMPKATFTGFLALSPQEKLAVIRRHEHDVASHR